MLNLINKSFFIIFAIYFFLYISCDAVLTHSTNSATIELFYGNIKFNNSTAQYDFGNVEIGSPTQKLNIIIYNSGNETLQIDNINIDDTSSDCFLLQDTTLDKYIDKGKSSFFTITYSPKQIKSDVAMLTITSNSQNSQIFSINLLGTGVNSPVVDMPRPEILLKNIPVNFRMHFTSSTTSANISVGVNYNIVAEVPSSWENTSDITLSNCGKVRIFSKATKSGFPDSKIYSTIVNVVSSFCSGPDSENSDAMYKDSDDFVEWANNVTDVNYGMDLDATWETPQKALGKATTDIYDVVSLGNEGNITLSFSKPIVNGYGDDFAVFENAINDYFLELAFVEVSSNGTDFARFDNISLTSSCVTAYGSLTPSNIEGLAGKYRVGYGVPFDLEMLSNSENVINGKVDIYNIRYVKIVDIIGADSTCTPPYSTPDYDSLLNVIYDPYKTEGSAGFDLEAIGVINN